MKTELCECIYLLCFNLLSANPQNGKTHSNNSSAIVGLALKGLRDIASQPVNSFGINIQDPLRKWQLIFANAFFLDIC